jgi:hypothetical protein
VLHKISLALWGEVAPVRVSERGSLLARLYGPSDLVRFFCTAVVGVGALAVRQSRIESEFPPSVRLTPATFPQGGRLISGSCFAVAMFTCFLYKYKRGSYNKPRPLGRGGTRKGVGEGELACGIVWPCVCSAG